MPVALSVNLNAVAQLRNRRGLPWPNVVGLGRIALEAGAAGLTVHPRPDQRHIRRSDVPELRALLDDEFPDREFNVEGYPTEEFLFLVEEIEPEQVTLVPDDPAQATSDHGWDFERHRDTLRNTVERLKAGGMRVSCFCDPDPAAADAALAVGTDRIELYTGPYGATHDDPDAARTELAKLVATAERAVAHGMGVNAGHDLTVKNLAPLVRAVPSLAEVSIGHALTADALVHGMERTVGRYLSACRGNTA